MNDKSRYLGSVLATMKQLSLAALAAVFLVALPVASNAQETSADMRGMVTDESGNPVPSAAVTIRNDSTGLTRSTTSAADGGYVIRNLPVGQEVYSMTVDGEGFASARRSGVSIILGGTATQDFALSTTGEMEEILVFGTQQSVSQVAVGPTASFGLEALQAAPARHQPTGQRHQRQQEPHPGRAETHPLTSSATRSHVARITRSASIKTKAAQARYWNKGQISQ